MAYPPVKCWCVARRYAPGHPVQSAEQFTTMIDFMHSSASTFSGTARAKHAALRQCPTVKMAYALLIRGQQYRFGCDNRAIEVQDAAMRSQYSTITQSLRECGHTVDVLLALNWKSCANETLLARLATWHRGSVQHTWQMHSNSQPENVRLVLDTYRPIAHRYHVLIVTRYDLVLKRPMHHWPGCQDQESTVGFSDLCDDVKWKSWNCTGDLMFVIPRKHFWAFDDAVRRPPLQPTRVYDHIDHRNRQRVYSKIMPSACFMDKHEITTKGFPHGAGHGCYNAVADRIGYQPLSLCWHRKVQPKRFQANTSFYQCCNNGEGNLRHSIQRDLPVTAVPF